GFREDNKSLKGEVEKLRSEMNTEMKGFREDNKSLKQEVENLRSETNEQFTELKSEFKEFNEHQKGLKSSVEVMLSAFNNTHYELIQIKEYLADRVIWDNDSINIVAESGKVIYGTIKKAEKKP
ncbi:MAG: hypothetical protein COZ80_04900, partial [Ignavibacteria bacterium CG_4_8_14_3_um_filter_37_9]